MFNVGDRILGQWEPEWFYPGVIVAEAGGQFEVQFDDGGRANLAPDQVRPINLQVGTRVQGRWQGGKQYYAGRITSITGHALHVAYDDGDREGTSASLLRINRADC